VSADYVVRPKADQDLDSHADYLAQEASLEVALRFIAAAHETFALLATRPHIGWHSRLKHAALKTARVFRVSGFEQMLVLYRTLPGGIEILRVIHGSRNLQALLRRRGEIEPPLG
jgi:toxin ParE1/3/4